MRQEPIAAIIFKTKNLVSLFQLLPNPTALYKNDFFFFYIYHVMLLEQFQASPDMQTNIFGVY